MYTHITESDEAKKFFDSCGIHIMKASCHNMVIIKNSKTQQELHIYAESDSNIVAGIPGIYIDSIGGGKDA